MKSLNELLDLYRALLNDSWLKLQVFATDIEGEYMLNDWKQFNWELIVECHLNQKEKLYLEPYGEGADYYGDSSRILQPEAIPTHAIFCQSETDVVDKLTGNKISLSEGGLPIECFVAYCDGWYYEKPPFDCVLIITGQQQIVVNLKDVNFTLGLLKN